MTTVRVKMLPELIAFLGSKPPAEMYDYTQSSTCVIAQFLQSIGEKEFSIPSREITTNGWGYIAQGNSHAPNWCFGDAYQRALEVQAGRSPHIT